MPEDADAAPTAPAGGEDAAPQDDDAEAAAPAQDALVAMDDAEPEDEEGRGDDRPRHERLGIDEALIYGPPEDWGDPASEVAVPVRAVAEKAPRGLKAAAAQVLAAWGGTTDEARLALPDAMIALRAALSTKPGRAPREPNAVRKPREGTKQEAVLAMLRREEGATIAQICGATGWQQHTVRGFFAGLKKRQGIEVQVLERVRQVGPGTEGARWSYSVYRAEG